MPAPRGENLLFLKAQSQASTDGQSHEDAEVPNIIGPSVCRDPASKSQAMPATVEAVKIQLSFRVPTDRLYAPCPPIGDKVIGKIPRFSSVIAPPPSHPSSPGAPGRFGSVKGFARAFFRASPDRVVHAGVRSASYIYGLAKAAPARNAATPWASAD